MHDRTRVEAGIFHDFHVAWIGQIRTALNGGLLPDGYYALAEQHAGRSSPANNDREEHVEEFPEKVVSALDVGVHVLLVDLFPPSPRDRQGMHGVIRQRLEQSDELYDLPADEPLTLAGYAAGPLVEAYLEHVAVGARLPDIPLFLRPDRYIDVPLEATYAGAYGGVPTFWRDVLERAVAG